MRRPEERFGVVETCDEMAFFVDSVVCPLAVECSISPMPRRFDKTLLDRPSSCHLSPPKAKAQVEEKEYLPMERSTRRQRK